MFIDRTYFNGDINIPNSEGEAVGPLIDWYIQKYEPEFLRKLLGSAGYQTLLTTDITLPANQKWFDMVRGKEFSLYGRGYSYFGLAPVGDISISYISNPAYNVSFVVDAVGGPASGQADYVNLTLAGKTYTVFKSGYGPLNPGVHVSIDADGGFTLLGGELFASGAEYTLLVQAGTTQAIVAGSEGLKESPIANYVYYWFVRNMITQTTTSGGVKTKNENAEMANMGDKMEKAWNEISRWERDFDRYVQYVGTFDFPYRYGARFGTINELNI